MFAACHCTVCDKRTPDEIFAMHSGRTDEKMTQYVNSFKDYLVNSKDVAANTLESYVRDVNAFISFASQYSVTEPSRVTVANIELYVEQLKALKKSNSTVTRSIASLRSFFQFLVLHGYASTNPARSVKLEKIEKKLPSILTNQEIDRLLKSPNSNEPKGCRDKAMFELLYATGIRVSELVSLNIQDINLNVGILNCHNGKASRIIPIYPEALKALSEYIYRVRIAIVPDNDFDALFINLNGSRLTRQGFWKIIKTYAEKASIKAEITPHTLRHSFAAHLLENGAQLKDIKEMLGHADISSTQVYAQIMKNKFKDVYNRCHPRA